MLKENTNELELINTLNNKDIQTQQVEILIDNVCSSKKQIVSEDLTFILIEKAKMLDIQKKEKLYVHLMEYSDYIKDKELNNELFKDNKLDEVVDYYFNKFPNDELSMEMYKNKELNSASQYHLFRFTNDENLKENILVNNTDIAKLVVEPILNDNLNDNSYFTNVWKKFVDNYIESNDYTSLNDYINDNKQDGMSIILASKLESASRNIDINLNDFEIENMSYVGALDKLSTSINKDDVLFVSTNEKTSKNTLNELAIHSDNEISLNSIELLESFIKKDDKKESVKIFEQFQEIDKKYENTNETSNKNEDKHTNKYKYKQG